MQVPCNISMYFSLKIFCKTQRHTISRVNYYHFTPTFIPKKDMTFDSAQALVDEWIKTKGVRYFSGLTNLGILMEEVGELSRIMVRQFGEQSFKPSDENKNLEDELADVLWVLICIANQTGINLEAAFKKNIEKKNHRDATRHLNNPKLK